jgi:hypothetical protein
MELELTHWDIARLFKSAFANELTPETIRKYGFKVSPELEKAALGKVKIADLTVGELLAMIQGFRKITHGFNGPRVCRRRIESESLKPSVRGAQFLLFWSHNQITAAGRFSQEYLC